ncbi:1319_t:CDS:2, partial [Dentiscutata heterogama]
KDVDLRHLPTAYSTAHSPRPGLCDSWVDTLIKEDLDNDDDDIESNKEEPEEIEEVDISPRLIVEMNQIEHW